MFYKLNKHGRPCTTFDAVLIKSNNTLLWNKYIYTNLLINNVSKAWNNSNIETNLHKMLDGWSNRLTNQCKWVAEFGESGSDWSEIKRTDDKQNKVSTDWSQNKIEFTSVLS